MRKFYEIYSSLHQRFYKALDGYFLKDFLLDNEEMRPRSIGASYFVKTTEESITLQSYSIREGKVSEEYPEFIGIPIRSVWKQLDPYWKSELGIYFNAILDKVLPAFWNDLCDLLNMKEKLNLDLLDINTPPNITSVAYSQGYIFVRTSDGGKPFMYSVERLPTEYEILRRIKSLISV